MKKEFIVSKKEAPQDGSHYVLVAFTDPNAKLTGEGDSGETVLESFSPIKKELNIKRDFFSRHFFMLLYRNI
jgi:hypothetical protein